MPPCHACARPVAERYYYRPGCIAPVGRRMEALILNGALAGDAELDAVQELLSRELAAAGCRTRGMVLRDLPVAYCQGCFECWLRTPGTCKTDDAGREIAAAVIRSDVVALLTPVTFGGYSSELKKALDRVAGLVSPFFMHIQGEVHHRPRYARYPALLAVGMLPRPDPAQERVFHTLVQRKALNIHAPWHEARVLYRGDAPATRLEVIRSVLEERIGRAA